jgi:hypothetical protein
MTCGNVGLSAAMEEEEKSVLTGNTPNVMIQLLHNLAVF